MSPIKCLVWLRSRVGSLCGLIVIPTSNFRFKSDNCLSKFAGGGLIVTAYLPVSVYDLASNMGTSVRVIESNYGDRDNVARGQKMGRKSWDTDSDNNDKDYPFL
jgi:hypothetical protein